MYIRRRIRRDIEFIIKSAAMNGAIDNGRS
jgi:hypothetical protein